MTNFSTNDISMFSIDTTTEALTPIGDTVPTEDGPNSIVVDSRGRFAYVTNALVDKVSVFAIDAGTGVLTEAFTTSAAGFPSR